MIFSKESFSSLKEDSIKAERYFEIAWEHRNNYPDSSFLYAQRSLKLSKKWNLQKLKAYNLGRIANYYENIGNYTKAYTYLIRSLNIRLTYNDTNDIFNGYNNLGVLFIHQEKYDSAISSFEVGLNYKSYNKFLSQQAKALNGLSVSYKHLGNYEEAEITLNKALDIGIRLNDSLGIAKRYQNLGSLYEQIKRYELAFKNYSLALQIYSKLNDELGIVDVQINRASILLHQSKYEEAITELRKAQKTSFEREFLGKRLTILNNLGFAYQAIGQLSKAQEKYSVGFEFALKNDQKRSLVEIGINQGYLLKEKKQYQELLKKMDYLEKIILEEELSQFLYHVYLLRADALAGLENYKTAFQTRLQFFDQLDSLEQKIDDAQILAAEIEQAKSEQALLQEKNQHQETELLKQQAENKAQMIGIIALSLLLLAVLIIFSLRLKHARTKATAEKNKKKSEEELLGILKKVDIQILEKQIEAKEKASIKIGQDLHDNLGSKLAVVQMLYDGVTSKLNSTDKEVGERLKKMGMLIEESCEDMRNVAHDLMDAELKEKGILSELDQYFSLLDGVKGIEFRLNSIDDFQNQLSENTEKEILAILRLLTENILRHADAEKVNVFIEEKKNVLSFKIEDNGNGFDVNQALRNGGKGLKNAKHRTKELGGEFNIKSNNKGTVAVFTIPLKRNIA